MRFGLCQDFPVPGHILQKADLLIFFFCILSGQVSEQGGGLAARDVDRLVVDFYAGVPNRYKSSCDMSIPDDIFSSYDGSIRRLNRLHDFQRVSQRLVQIHRFALLPGAVEGFFTQRGLGLFEGLVKQLPAEQR